MKKVRFIRTIRCTIHLKPKALEPTAYRILLVASTKRVKGAPKKTGFLFLLRNLTGSAHRACSVWLTYLSIIFFSALTMHLLLTGCNR